MAFTYALFARLFTGTCVRLNVRWVKLGVSDGHQARRVGVPFPFCLLNFNACINNNATQKSEGPFFFVLCTETLTLWRLLKKKCAKKKFYIFHN
jgi:hypothetical protein